MGRFETEWLANDENLVALTDLGGRWIDRVHSRRPLNGIVLDMDSSVSETYGDQEGTAYNGHFACTCYHPLFVFNQFGDLEGCAHDRAAETRVTLHHFARPFRIEQIGEAFRRVPPA